MAWSEGGELVTDDWSQLLTIPVDGYLEVAGGPIPFRDVAWVEVATNRIKGGIAERPLEMVDIKSNIMEALCRTSVKWRLVDTTWSKDRLFNNLAVQVFHIETPFAVDS
jgi:hypothetical protein